MGKTGRNYVQWFGADAHLVITEPELIKEVLNNQHKDFPKAKLQGHIHKIFGNGLATAEGQRWVNSRKLAHFAFHGDSLKVNLIKLFKLTQPLNITLIFIQLFYNFAEHDPINGSVC